MKMISQYCNNFCPLAINFLNQKPAFEIKPFVLLAALAIFGTLGMLCITLLRSIRRNTNTIDTKQQKTWAIELLSVCWKPGITLLSILSIYIAIVIILFGVVGQKNQATVFDLLNPITSFAILSTCVWAVIRLLAVTERRIQRWSNQTQSALHSLFLNLAIQGFNIILPILVLTITISTLELPTPIKFILQKTTSIALIIGTASLLIRATGQIEQALLIRYRIDSANNLEARKIYTQAAVIKKIINTLVILIALGCVLMAFDPVRQLGTSILASAGIAGIILGFAAQKTLADLFAGIQIAIAQPIRIDDVVVVENEFGRVEEITLTYVAIKLWDLRRLIVPVTYFLEKPFQNWTRTGSKILGTVFLYVDYTVQIDKLRTELHRIVKSSTKWDGDVCVLQVTDTKENVIELRCLASATDTTSCWDLRCEIREKMIKFIQEHFPCSLPHIRALVQVSRSKMHASSHESSAATNTDNFFSENPNLQGNRPASSPSNSTGIS